MSLSSRRYASDASVDFVLATRQDDRRHSQPPGGLGDGVHVLALDDCPVMDHSGIHQFLLVLGPVAGVNVEIGSPGVRTVDHLGLVGVDTHLPPHVGREPTERHRVTQRQTRCVDVPCARIRQDPAGPKFGLTALSPGRPAERAAVPDEDPAILERDGVVGEERLVLAEGRAVEHGHREQAVDVGLAGGGNSPLVHLAEPEADHHPESPEHFRPATHGQSRTVVLQEHLEHPVDCQGDLLRDVRIEFLGLGDVDALEELDRRLVEPLGRIGKPRADVLHDRDHGTDLNPHTPRGVEVEFVGHDGREGRLVSTDLENPQVADLANDAGHSKHVLHALGKDRVLRHAHGNVAGVDAGVAQFMAHGEDPAGPVRWSRPVLARRSVERRVGEHRRPERAVDLAADIRRVAFVPVVGGHGEHDLRQGFEVLLPGHHHVTLGPHDPVLKLLTLQLEELDVRVLRQGSLEPGNHLEGRRHFEDIAKRRQESDTDLGWIAKHRGHVAQHRLQTRYVRHGRPPLSYLPCPAAE